MHVSPAKHSYAWLSRKCDYRTDRHTHTQTYTGQSDPYVPLCFAGDTKTVIVIQRIRLFWTNATCLEINPHFRSRFWNIFIDRIFIIVPLLIVIQNCLHDIGPLLASKQNKRGQPINTYFKWNWIFFFTFLLHPFVFFHLMCRVTTSFWWQSDSGKWECIVSVNVLIK